MNWLAPVQGQISLRRLVDESGVRAWGRDWTPVTVNGKPALSWQLKGSVNPKGGKGNFIELEFVPNFVLGMLDGFPNTFRIEAQARFLNGESEKVQIDVVASKTNKIWKVFKESEILLYILQPILRPTNSLASSLQLYAGLIDGTNTLPKAKK